MEEETSQVVPQVTADSVTSHDIAAHVPESDMDVKHSEVESPAHVAEPEEQYVLETYPEVDEGDGEPQQITYQSVPHQSDENIVTSGDHYVTSGEHMIHEEQVVHEQIVSEADMDFIAYETVVSEQEVDADTEASSDSFLKQGTHSVGPLTALKEEDVPQERHPPSPGPHDQQLELPTVSQHSDVIPANADASGDVHLTSQQHNIVGDIHQRAAPVSTPHDVNNLVLHSQLQLDSASIKTETPTAQKEVLYRRTTPHVRIKGQVFGSVVECKEMDEIKEEMLPRLREKHGSTIASTESMSTGGHSEAAARRMAREAARAAASDADILSVRAEVHADFTGSGPHEHNPNQNGYDASMAPAVLVEKVGTSNANFANQVPLKDGRLSTCDICGLGFVYIKELLEHKQEHFKQKESLKSKIFSKVFSHPKYLSEQLEAGGGVPATGSPQEGQGMADIPSSSSNQGDDPIGAPYSPMGAGGQSRRRKQNIPRKVQDSLSGEGEGDEPAKAPADNPEEWVPADPNTHPCPLCEVRYKHLHNLRTHMEDVHNVRGENLPVNLQQSPPPVLPSADDKKKRRGRPRKDHVDSYDTPQSRKRSAIEEPYTANFYTATGDVTPVQKKRRGRPAGMDVAPKPTYEPSPGGKGHACSTCGKSFSRFPLLQQHMASHSEDRPYKCQLCDKRFKLWNALYQHQHVHTGEKRYACPYCNNRYTQAGSRNFHIRRYHAMDA